MITHYEEEDTKLDKSLLIVRRIFLILFIGLILWIILFKIILINKNKWIKIDSDTTSITGAIANNGNKNININKYKDLGKYYAKDDKHVYYKGKIIPFVKANKFHVITTGRRYTAQGLVTNSDNLLKIFANYNTRVYLMKYIDNIIKNDKNIATELKSASENGMYKMKKNQNELNQFDRNDRYEMTNEQRAKFAIMFLYIKIAKSMNNNAISMKVALQELKNFLDNFDEDNLKDEIQENEIKKIRGNIGLDDHCIYKNGELYACFLDKIFIK